MNYSPISYMRVRNFRNIGDVTIDFSDSPIVTLIGENEAGKTSIVKAFCVAGLNAFTTKQKNYIREGTTGFGVEIALSDGTVIQRIKTNASNQLAIQKPNGEVWQASKIDKGSIPVELQTIMGLIEEAETKEYLQVRTYENQLLFVVTPGSTNYKVMYDALKVDQLTKALKLGTEQANRLKRDIDESQVIIKALMDNIRQIRLYDIEPVVNIKNRLKGQITKLDRLEEAKRISQEIEQMETSLGAIRLLEESNVTQVDINTVNILSSINRVRNNISEMNRKLSIYSNLDTIGKIDTTVIAKLRDAIGLKNKVDSSEVRIGIYSKLSKLDTIDISSAMLLAEAHKAANKVAKYEKQLSILELDDAKGIPDSSINKISKLRKAINLKHGIIAKVGELTQLEQERERITNLLKESGAVVADCPKCGESVVVDVRAYN